MEVWTYAVYANGRQRPVPKPFDREVDEADENDLEEMAEQCADDDHRNYDGWDGGRDERSIFLFRDGAHHSTYTVTVDYEPTFTAQRAAAQKGE